MLDPINDMLTRIRNAQMAGHKEVIVPASKVKLAIAGILEKEGFVELVQREKDDVREYLKIKLKYEQSLGTGRIPSISGIKRVSQSGKRMYIGKDEIKSVKNDYGIAIISTSKGVMTGRDARKMGLGGEYICKVW